MRDECWHPECYMINKVCSFSKHMPILTSYFVIVLERQNNNSETHECSRDRRFCAGTTSTCWGGVTRDPYIVTRQASSDGAAGLSDLDVRFFFVRISIVSIFWTGYFRPLRNRVPRVYPICYDKSVMEHTLMPFEWQRNSFCTSRFFSERSTI